MQEEHKMARLSNLGSQVQEMVKDLKILMLLSMQRKRILQEMELEKKLKVQDLD